MNPSVKQVGFVGELLSVAYELLHGKAQFAYTCAGLVWPVREEILHVPDVSREVYGKSCPV